MQALQFTIILGDPILEALAQGFAEAGSWDSDLLVGESRAWTSFGRPHFIQSSNLQQ